MAANSDRLTALVDGPTSPWKAETMSDMQLFAFVILPLIVGALGALATWAARFIP